MKLRMRRSLKKLGAGIALLFSPALAFASTSGGVFSPITGQMNTVLTGMQDMGGLVAAGGLVATGLAWWHGGEHKKAIMIGLGATIGGIAMANAKSLATSITGGATMGQSHVLGLVALHAVHLVGI
ncbi:TrbC/VirB2 family protein [Acidithiobacillus montserratensis]|uniref:TrbC/VirB2 family protein n=1 Tax=Acidithiobacillus montserratensis TaxID=2729135 RepID=A0ACD5HJE3_9PROT|nr:TrbC/VirB2 family protein [Acidithiobacillus montserratensis]MBU2747851.1 conjugal transfer protein TrbC [Acidithiobacillus montserratensis]